MSARPEPLAPVHGGPDGGPAILHDFSTNANAAGAAPAVLAAVRAADRRRYPDPAYSALRARLAERLGVEVDRVLPAAGASEAIGRLTLAASLRGARAVLAPRPGYGDYARAAAALGLPVLPWQDAPRLLGALRRAPGPVLAWACEPCNPTGGSLPAPAWAEIARALAAAGGVLAIDRAYEPLRLRGVDPVPAAVAEGAWQCWSWNKACGLTGVRAAYLVAPRLDGPRRPAARALRDTVAALAPSWVLGAESVAFLEAATAPGTERWLAGARARLSRWERAQRASLQAAGWRVDESVTPFFLATPPWPASAQPGALAALRAAGLKLRDAASFGLPGRVRLSVQPPASQRALLEALRALAPDRGVRPTARQGPREATR